MPPPGVSKVDGSGSWLVTLISGLVIGVPSGGDEGVLFAFAGVLSLQRKERGGRNRFRISTSMSHLRIF